MSDTVLPSTETSRPADTSRADTRSVIVDVAARLLQEYGPDAVTTRRVAQGAGVQAPTIYRLFGDKDGLLEAVAEHVMATFVSAKAAIVEAASADGTDPLDDLRAGWRSQIEFGLANPSIFRLLSDPGRAVDSPAAASGRRVLEARVRRVAASGRLRVSEQRAVALIHAAGVGAVQTLLATPAPQRDPALPEELYEAVLARILTDPGTHPDVRSGGETAAAIMAFRAVAPDLDALTPAERTLVAEWLDRVIAGL